MIQFGPAILKDDVLIEFPRPLTVCRIHDSWDFMKMKVPLQDGEQISGPSRDGVDVILEGQLGSHAGELKLSEAMMLETLLTLREALNVSGDQTFELVLFHDEAGVPCRSLRRCVPNRFDVDFSNPHVYAYSVSIHAADPVLYSAGQ
jgi:hypothetical protein